MRSSAKRKVFTLIVIPHSDKATHAIKIPLAVVQCLGVFLIIALVSVVVVAQSYHQLKAQAAGIRELSALNNQQREQLLFFVRETQQIVTQLESLELLQKGIKDAISLQPRRETLGASILSPARRIEPLLQALENVGRIKDLLPKTEAGLKDISITLSQWQNREAGNPSIWPTEGRVTSGYGYRRSPFGMRREFHNGLDIAAASGTPVYVTADGEVTMASYNGSYGRMVEIDHGRGIRTSYSHLSKYVVQDGDRVYKGQLIAYVGSTGRSTGPHLHYEVLLNGVPVNPTNYLP